jgi:hypothetical protein
MWEREESLSGEIRQSWVQGETIQNLGDVARKLTRVMRSLKNWSMEKFGAVTKEIGDLKEKIEALCVQDYLSNKERIGNYTNRLEELLHREELMWMQRSRVAWLKEGDRNTKFFHMKAAGHAKKNKIKNLRTKDGRLIIDRKEMGNMTRSFFQELYTKDDSVCPTELI